MLQFVKISMCMCGDRASQLSSYKLGISLPSVAGALPSSSHDHDHPDPRSAIILVLCPLPALKNLFTNVGLLQQSKFVRGTDAPSNRRRALLEAAQGRAGIHHIGLYSRLWL